LQRPAISRGFDVCVASAIAAKLYGRKPMSRIRMLVGLGALALGSAALGAPVASAANTATFRDCALIGGIDPDFVALSGATAGPQGTLTTSQNQVQLVASESADPGDNAGHDTFSVTVTAPNAPTRMLSGNGVGKVSLTVPLTGAPAGSSYTIAWMATFDNGNHSCPSSSTPENTMPAPFVVAVSGGGGGGGGGGTGTKKHKTKSKCHTVTKHIRGRTHKSKVCTKTKHK
jgi:hypothetical protein